jgi:Holliday junction resolvase-like predicted endonuclease
VSAEERKAYLSAKGKISRARGAEWERYYARYLTKTLGLEFRRNLTQYQQKGCGDLLTKLDSLYRSVFIEVKYRSVETHSTFFRETVVKYGNAALEAEAPFLLVIYKLQGKSERCWFGLAKDAASKTADYTPFTLDDALRVMKATVYGGE